MDAVFSFKTTYDAIRAERILLDADESVRVMPLPGQIAAGCGICLRIPPDRREAAAALLERGGVHPQAVHLSINSGYKPFPSPFFSRLLGLGVGDVAAIIGCAGKTALANRLAMENRHLPVLFSTTTHIAMPSGAIVDRRLGKNDALAPGVNLLCEPDGGKLRGVDAVTLARLRPADGVTILEADGSRGMPLKGWAEYEPVVPAFASITVGVCSVCLVGRVFSGEFVHRPEIFCEITGLVDGEVIGVDHVAAMVETMFRKAVGRRMLFINQVETPELDRIARSLADRLGDLRIAAGSVRDGVAVLLAGGCDE